MTRWSAITRTRGRRSALAYGSRSTTAAEDNLNRLVHHERGRYSQASAVAESPPGTEWYEELRERYRPERLRYLLIAESPPDPGEGERRFFYSPALTIDNLY